MRPLYRAGQRDMCTVRSQPVLSNILFISLIFYGKSRAFKYRTIFTPNPFLDTFEYLFTQHSPDTFHFSSVVKKVQYVQLLG